MIDLFSSTIGVARLGHYLQFNLSLLLLYKHAIESAVVLLLGREFDGKLFLSWGQEQLKIRTVPSGGCLDTRAPDSWVQGYMDTWSIDTWVTGYMGNFDTVEHGYMGAQIHGHVYIN